MSRSAKHLRKTHSFGFTLVELLVVIAIIGILIGMLLPAVQAVREAARRSECMNQARQLPLAALNFESALMRLPVGAQHVGRNNDSLGFGWGWRTHILPYMEQGNLADGLDTTLKLTDTVNIPFVEQSVGTFICPSDPELADTPWTGLSVPVAMSSYMGNGGSIEWAIAPTEAWSDGILMRARDRTYNGITLGEITDGTSNTFFCGETLSYAILLGRTFIWDPAMYAAVKGDGTAARTLSQVRTGHGQFNPDHLTSSDAILRNSYASNHTGGAVFAYCDGSTHFIAESIEHTDPVLSGAEWESGKQRSTYQILFSRNDGGVVPAF